VLGDKVQDEVQDDEAKTTKKKKKKTKKPAEAETKTPVFEPANVTELPLGSRVPCLGCGAALTMLPSRQAPEHCDICMQWHDKICDAFDRLQNGTDKRLQTSDERELEELWAERRGDPSFSQETRDQWNAAEPSFFPPQTSGSTSFTPSSSETTTTATTDSKKKKKKRKQRTKKKVVITIKEDDEDDDEDDEETDPRQLGWEECAQRGRAGASSTANISARSERGRPLQRKK
jgi:hypothetical protein